MSLPQPREGELAGFSTKPNEVEGVTTLGDPERLIWSSIKRMGVPGVASNILEDVHGITSKRKRNYAAYNLQFYIQQASEFYETAKSAKTHTAPLFYYYSFLNLAKALCEIKNPQFHKQNECYLHGLSWTPNREYEVNMETESVRLTQRSGVWQALWEVIQASSFNRPSAPRLALRDLFALCPELSVEYTKAYERPSALVGLTEPEILIDSGKNEVWVRFKVARDELRKVRLSRNKFLKLVTHTGSPYRQVQSDEEEFWVFELEHPKRIPAKFKGTIFGLLEAEIKAMNLFTELESEGLGYSVPIQSSLPIPMPQILVLYTIIFWFGSLVRYDPLSVFRLQDSEYWLVLDGFIHQSCVWLLELFEWEFYKREADIRRVR
jgi:hypothetical protein